MLKPSVMNWPGMVGGGRAVRPWRHQPQGDGVRGGGDDLDHLRAERPRARGGLCGGRRGAGRGRAGGPGHGAVAVFLALTIGVSTFHHRDRHGFPFSSFTFHQR